MSEENNYNYFFLTGHDARESEDEEKVFHQPGLHFAARAFHLESLEWKKYFVDTTPAIKIIMYSQETTNKSNNAHIDS